MFELSEKMGTNKIYDVEMSDKSGSTDKAQSQVQEVMRKLSLKMDYIGIGIDIGIVCI